jgi:hypothetical protein
MSQDAKTLMHWIKGWRDTAIADYANVYEFWCARRWAEYIIGRGCE